MSFARKVDENHVEIVDVFRKSGWLVESTSRLGGFIDVVAFHPLHMKMLLIEIKRPKAKLKPSQQRLIKQGWPITILRTVDEAQALAERT